MPANALDLPFTTASEAMAWIVLDAWHRHHTHYCDVIMGALAFQITSFMAVYSTVYADVDQRKYESSVWNSSVTGEFPTQRASNAENVSIWWHHHEWRVLIMLINSVLLKQSNNVSKSFLYVSDTCQPIHNWWTYVQDVFVKDWE